MLTKFKTFSFCTTLYQKLGVQPNDSIENIKSAYIKLAKIYHPDVNLAQKEQEFKEITNAYNILKDPAKRKLYDLSIDFQQHSKNESDYQSNYESSHQEKQYHNNPGWQYNGEQQKQWQNNNNQKNTYQQRTYQYTQQKSNSNQIYGLLALGGISIVFWSILSDDDDYSEKPRITKPAAPSIKISENPTSYAELKQIYDSIEQIDSKKMQRYYTHQAEEDQTELRRQNVIYQGQNLNDSPFIIEQRRKMMNEEMKQKKFKIQVEQYEKVIKGDSKILKRKDSNSQKKELKTKQGDLTLQGFAKQNKLDINKSNPPQQNKPINISIEHLEQGYM